MDRIKLCKSARESTEEEKKKEMEGCYEIQI